MYLSHTVHHLSVLAVCTGISGSGKKDYLKDFQHYVEDEHGKKLEWFDVGDYVESEAMRLFEQSHIAISKAGIDRKILDLPRSTARELGVTALEQILSKIGGRRGNYIISMHACFRWKKGLTLTVDANYLDRFKPDLFFTLTDEASNIKDSLENYDPKWKGRLSEADIAAWQQEEIASTKILAGYRRKDFRFFKVNTPKKNVFDYIFRSKIRRRRLPTSAQGGPKTVYCTAISGTKAREYLKAFCHWAKKAHKRKITLLDLGAHVVKKAHDEKQSVTRQNILREKEDDLNRWRQEALSEIRDERRRCGDCIIIGHMCFRLHFEKEKLLLGYDPEGELVTWSTINPDLYVTFTDNILSNKIRLNTDDRAEGLDLSLREIAIWHDEERFFTRLIAENFKKPHYILPLTEPFETLYRIIFEQDRKRIYLSFPITEVLKKRKREQEKIFAQKNELRDELRKPYVVFDPLDIHDGALLKLLDEKAKFPHPLKDHLIVFKESSDDSIERQTQSLKVSCIVPGKFKIKRTDTTFSKKELEEAVGYIKDQIFERDYYLIDQSNCITVYYPVTDVSPGVLAEVIYGFSHGRDAFAWWFKREVEKKEEVSPFLESYLNKICYSKKELLKILTKYSKTAR